jgi:glycosyltransferase involved in cell wall biosynthesis
MKKKLLISTDAFLPRWDGISRFLSEMIPVLSEKYDVTVIAPKFAGKLPKLDAKIIRFPLVNLQFGDIWFTWPRFKDVAAIVKNTDIVFNQTIGPIGIAAIRAAHKYKKPVVSYMHIIEWEMALKSITWFRNVSYHFTRLLARRLYNKCSLILVPTKELIHILEDNKIRTSKRIVHLGTNVAKFIPPLSKNEAKRAVKINPRLKVIGYCGRIAREKDVLTLHKAFVELQKKHKDIMLLIVGTGLKEVEDEMLKTKNVRITGSTDNVVPYFQAMDIYSLPSLTETTSLTTLEAMSCGLPVIATPVGYIKRYIENGKNGFLFKQGDFRQLAVIISKLLKSESLREKVGKEARKTVVDNYRWQFTSDQIMSVLEQLGNLKKGKKSLRYSK